MMITFDERTAVDTTGARVKISQPSSTLGAPTWHLAPSRPLNPPGGPDWLEREPWAILQGAVAHPAKNGPLALMVTPLKYASSAASIDRYSEEWVRSVADFLSAAAIRLRGLYDASRDPEERIDPIDREVMRSVLEYLARMAVTSKIERPKMFPLADGGIGLQWKLPDGKVVVEFDADGDRTALIRASGSRRSAPLDQLDGDILHLIAR